MARAREDGQQQQRARRRTGPREAPVRRRNCYFCKEKVDEIDHKGEGAYHLLTFKAAPQTLGEVTRVLKITDGVIRHMATRRPKEHRRALTSGPPPEAVEPAELAAEPIEDSEEGA